MRSFLFALFAWLLCGFVLFLFATNLWQLWGLWLIALGILLGKCLSQIPLSPEKVGGGLVLAILGIIIIRALPIYSLDCTRCSQIKITQGGRDWQIEITDPAKVEIFKSYATRGHYETIQKSGYGYRIEIGNSNGWKGYYVHGDCLGNMPGGYIQSVFVPHKDGFRQFFESVLKEYGHERE